jgi:UDP-N-acetylmuramyl tripeptide synthase
VWVVLVKNPTGFNQALRLVLGDEDREVDTLLLALNDNGPDGRDVSWIWDVDFERVAERPPHRLTISGTRAYDLALRLKYAGIADAGDASGKPSLELEQDVLRAFWSAVEQTPPGGTVYMLPTYTAMWAVRETLAREGHLPLFWQHNQPTVAAA